MRARKPTALDKVRAHYDQAGRLGIRPAAMAVTPDEYKELLGAGGFEMRWPPRDLVVMGVPIMVDHGPYPWGSFPDA